MSGGSGARFAWLGTRRQLTVTEPDGRQRPLTFGPSGQVLWGSWQGGAARGESACSWPTWSPDGRSIATFRLPDVEHLAPRLSVLDADGIGEVELFELVRRLPIYLQWSPDGRWIAVLSQSEHELELSTGQLAEPGREHRIAHGIPLFCSWASAERLAAFVGSTSQPGSARIALYEPRGKIAEVLPGTPGNFCAPVTCGDQLLYVVQQEEDSLVVASRPGDHEPRVLETLQGLVALVRSPDGRYVARAVAPGGDGTPYEDLAILDVETGLTRTLYEDRCLAFFWSPVGDRLVIARVDTDRNLLEWLTLGLDGQLWPVADTYPTRDLGFYLRFFEQYAQSHPIVDPTGRWMLIAGRLHGSDDEDETAGVWEVPLDGGEPHRVADGLFGVYAPRSG